MNMDKYYGQLVGFKIIGFEFEQDEFGGHDWPVFTLEKDGEKITAAISRDAEGNGGGFIFVEEQK